MSARRVALSSRVSSDGRTPSRRLDGPPCRRAHERLSLLRRVNARRSTSRRDVGRPPSRPALLYAEASAAEGDRIGRGGTVRAMPGDRAGLGTGLVCAGQRSRAARRCGWGNRRLSGAAAASDLEDVLGASLTLARLGEVPTPAAAAPAYVARLFDASLRRVSTRISLAACGSRGPALLYEAVRDVCERTNRPMHFARALDLGCGTGLAGAAFRGCVDHLEGVDLSEGIDRAGASQGHLRCAACWGDRRAAACCARAHPFDLIVATDVLVYIGDFTPLLPRDHPGFDARRSVGPHDGNSRGRGICRRFKLSLHARAELRPRDCRERRAACESFLRTPRPAEISTRKWPGLSA